MIKKIARPVYLYKKCFEVYLLIILYGGGLDLEITNFQGKGGVMKTPTEPESSSAGGSDPSSPAIDSVSPKPQRPLTLQVPYLIMLVVEVHAC